jgi:uncharacterized protein YcaQ
VGAPGHLSAVDADRVAVSLQEMVIMATEHTLRALGVARLLDIKQYSSAASTPAWPRCSAPSRKRTASYRCRVEGGASASETWYVHADAMAELEAIRAGDWQGRTALLSPFDNLINDRRLTERLWGFAFRNEMYAPKAKREYGYYLLPILHGDRLVGRATPRFDPSRGILLIEGLYLEAGIKPTATLCRAVTGQLADPAALIGATGIEYGDTLPERWRPMLHRS